MEQKIHKISVIIPVYNSSMIFPELYKRLVRTLENITPDFEIITVLDGCTDNSFSIISSISSRDKRVKIIEFSRNFGHQAAITAGLKFAKGELIAIMDDDLEDPPELLPRFIEKINEGYDVVYGIRKKRKRSIFYRFLYALFYRLFLLLSEQNVPPDAGDFCMIRKRVAETLNKLPERNRYLRGLRAWVGFSQTGIEYERGKRPAGTSGYSFLKYVSFALDAIFSFSKKPLRLITVLGFTIALFSLIGIMVIIFEKLLIGINVSGWASLFTAILFFSGVQLISIGLIGEYIARIYDEVKDRPLYIINRTIGF